MNARAQVTDAWRNEEVAANRLLADLNVVYQGNLGTDPKHDGIFRFDATNSTHKIGLQFDAPLIRRAERNAYKSSQIVYQQARRAWIEARDQAVRQLRLDIRQLNLYPPPVRDHPRPARDRGPAGRGGRILASGPAGRRTPATRSLLLQALQSLLNAKNSLIGNWVGLPDVPHGPLPRPRPDGHR